MNDREARSLETRIRGQIFAVIGATLAVLALLGFAVRDGSAGAWVVWVVFAVVGAAGAALAVRRARALSKWYQAL